MIYPCRVTALKKTNYKILGHMTLEVTGPQKKKFTVISETVREIERNRILDPYRVTACKITIFEILICSFLNG